MFSAPNTVVQVLCIWCWLCLDEVEGLKVQMVNDPVKAAEPITHNCLGLSSDAFPIEVEELLTFFGSDKKTYFRHLDGIGINDSLHVVARGDAPILPNSCLKKADTRKLHVFFVGDSVEREAFEAFQRNSGVKLSNKTAKFLRSFDDPNFAEYDRWPSLRRSSDHETLIQDNHEIQILDGKAEAFSWRIQAPESSFTNWGCGVFDDTDRFYPSMVQYLRDSMRDLKLDLVQDTVVLWVGCAVHAFFRGDRSWFTQREANQRELVTTLREVFPGMQLIWAQPPQVNTGLMVADPGKYDAFDFVAQDVERHMLDMAESDWMVMKKLNVPVVPRYILSRMYDGLQCDGLHFAPHLATKAADWGCIGFPGEKDLELQAGLSAACDRNDVKFCDVPAPLAFR